MIWPDAQTLYSAIEATWPAKSLQRVGPFTIREGGGGGSRVSSATVEEPITAADLPLAEAAMRRLGQPPLFMLRQGEEALDQLLADAGYRVKDPVCMYLLDLNNRIAAAPPITCFTAWPPVAAQRDIWRDGGIGPARLAVMDRAAGPKTSILGRSNDRPAGTVYAAINDGIAMLHALEVAEHARRQGLGGTLTRAVARWAQDEGATVLALLVTTANTGANALYSSLGMSRVEGYHYRIKDAP